MVHVPWSPQALTVPGCRGKQVTQHGYDTLDAQSTLGTLQAVRDSCSRVIVLTATQTPDVVRILNDAWLLDMLSDE